MNGKLFSDYHCFGFAYGTARKTAQVLNAKVTDDKYAAKPKTKPMYLTTKCAVVAYGAVLGTFAWPVMAMKDAHSLEAYIRGDSDSSAPMTVADYLLYS